MNMLKRQINECRFTLQLETKSPFLIKDGRYDKKEFVNRRLIPNNRDITSKFPDALFVCTNTEAELEAITVDNLKRVRSNRPQRLDYSSLNLYLPGTSLRGVIRSHAEQIVRTLTENDGESICCDPFEENEKKRMSCSKRLEKALEKSKKSSDAYRYACAICRMFGSTNNRSRIQVYDSTIVKQGVTNFRDSIGIDRFTGTVSANFKNQVLNGYTFQSEFVIHNFELWQLGVLAYVFQDFKDEMITLGFGKAKGFGRVEGQIVEPIEVTYLGEKADTRLTDLGDLMPEATEYDFIPGGLNDASLLNPTSNGSPLSYRKRFAVTDELRFWQSVAGVWNRAVDEDRFKPVSQLVPPANHVESD
jgi:CRISPR/Cas system CSM-associated protein Csm3 (group 7 of RAMP superfamily)